MAQYDKGEVRMECAQSVGARLGQKSEREEGRVLATVEEMDSALSALAHYTETLFSRIGEVLGPGLQPGNGEPSPKREPSCALEARLLDQCSRILSMSRSVQAYTARIKL